MNLRNFTIMGSLSLLAAGGAMLAPTRASASEQGVEELTRGPVHEAFAATVSYDPEPGIFVSTSPPGMIEEVPPDQRPEGDYVAWIPGYWGWDEEQNDYIWISGVWRNLPPGRQWIPGYWGEVGNRSQWTSGYWADEAIEEVTYVSRPPKSIESGPNVDAPSRNHLWISGTWINHDDRYAWRPGYWEPGQANWTWIPAHYQWTPRGYIFIEGYWDYDMERRGVVFAPVRFQREYYNRPNHTYTPLVVIALNVFTDHLFVRPSYGHYYFGDYYAPRYRNEGYYSSYAYRSGRSGYDPIYAQRRWQHRDDRNWEQSRRDDFAFYQSHEDARPPHTWAAMQARPENRRKGQRDNYQFAEPLQKYAAGSKQQKFQRVSADNRTKLVQQSKQVQKFSQERRQLENRRDGKVTESAGKDIQVKREKLQKSPVAAKRADQLSGRDAPPKSRVAKDVAPRNAKTAGPEGKAGKSTGQGSGKNEADPKQKADLSQPQKAAPNMNKNAQDSTKSPAAANQAKSNKPNSTPKRADAGPNTSKKQSMPQEPASKTQAAPKQERTAQPEKKPQKAQPEAARKTQAAPKQERKAQPEKKSQKAQPEATRKAPPEKKPQKAQPEAARQAQQQQQQQQQQQKSKPERKAQPEKKPQKAQPEAARQSKPHQQATQGKGPAASKKISDSEEDSKTPGKKR